MKKHRIFKWKIVIFHNFFFHISWSDKIDTPVCRSNFSWKCDRPSPEMRAMIIFRFLTKDTRESNEKTSYFLMKNRNFSWFFVYFLIKKKSTRRYVNRNSWLILWFSYEIHIFFVKINDFSLVFERALMFIAIACILLTRSTRI